MNYAGKKIGITGADSFIGKAVLQQLDKQFGESVRVIPIHGDTRILGTFMGQLDHTFDYLFHFAAPSSEVLFRRTPFYCADVTITGFMNAAKASTAYGIRLIYPSTGLLSMSNNPELKNKTELMGTIQALDGNLYARCKRICEDIARNEKIDSLGLRIFATYGPGEGHKRDYASVPYLFARDMVAGRKPVIYGDGSQARDFIYITDVAKAILVLAEDCSDPVIDIGSGARTEFNDIVRLINEALFAGEEHASIEPTYIDKPAGYVKETEANNSRMLGYYTPAMPFDLGISELVKHLREANI